MVFLGKQLRPVAAADPKRVADLLAGLDNRRFPVRQKALRELERLGASAEPVLRKAQGGKYSLEVRKRIDQLLRKLDGETSVRYSRALEVLELLGAAQAGPLLEKLAAGAPEVRLTREAKTSLERLNKRARLKN